jgi:ribose 5-phosphate isomerase B
MSEREFLAPDGRTWIFRVRPEARKEEASTHLTLEITTASEIRIVSCPLEEWARATPDLAGLLSRSVTAGGSRHVGPPPEQHGSRQSGSIAPVVGTLEAARPASSPESARMRIAIGSDHAGFEYKEQLKQSLLRVGHEPTDFGTDSAAPVDYPLIIRPLAEAIGAGRFDRGIILGGSGNGEAIVANRVRGVRCALCWNVESARLARQHNDANILSLGQRLIAEADLLPIVTTWLTTEFEGGRHARRLALIDAPPPSSTRQGSRPASG